jgi:hypothetical protein
LVKSADSVTTGTVSVVSQLRQVEVLGSLLDCISGTGGVSGPLPFAGDSDTEQFALR